MATESIGETPTLFLRKATGLVRGWSVRDSIIYACLATNVVTLGIYEFSFQSFIPKGQLLTSILMVIGTLQMIALAYGVHVLFESRPVNIVFVKDRFELVRANEYPKGELEKLESGAHGSLTWTGPRIVGAKLPTDPKERTDLVCSTIGGGPDVHLLPRYYVPYDEVRELAKQKGEPIQKLRDRNPGAASAAQIAAVLASIGRKENELLFLPMRAGKSDLTIFIDAKTGAILKISSIKPWGDV
jgi:hypothetical protein